MALHPRVVQRRLAEAGTSFETILDDVRRTLAYSWAASNSTTANRESHFYYGFNGTSGLVFCLNPGRSVDAHQLTDDFIDGNGIGQRNEISSLIVRNRTTVRCF